MSNLGVLVPILALLIPIVAIVMNNWRRIQDRKLDLIEKRTTQIGADAEQRLSRMEERIAVLERIATDRRINLADEIDRLEKKS